MRATVTLREWTQLDALMLVASRHVEALEAIADAVTRLVDVRRGSDADAEVDQALFTGQTTADLLARLHIEIETQEA